MPLCLCALFVPVPIRGQPLDIPWNTLMRADGGKEWFSARGQGYFWDTTLGRFPTYLIIRDAAVRAVTKGRIPGGLATTQIGNAVLGSPENLGHKSAAGMGAVTEGLT